MDDLLTMAPMAVWVVNLIDKPHDTETTLQAHRGSYLVLKLATQKDEEANANARTKMQTMFYILKFQIEMYAMSYMIKTQCRQKTMFILGSPKCNKGNFVPQG